MSSQIKIDIRSTKLREPDSDGDTRLEYELIIANLADSPIEFFKTICWIESAQGAVISTSSDDHEVSIVQGGESSLDADSGWIKANALAGGACKLNIFTEAYASSHACLGSIPLNEAEPGIYGLNAPVEVDGAIEIEAIGLSVEKPDEDREVRLEIKMLVRNKTEQFFSKVGLKSRLIGSDGEEIEESVSDEDLGPLEVKIIENSFYGNKLKKLKGASVSNAVSLYQRIYQAETTQSFNG